MNRRSPSPITEPAEGAGTHRRGWFFVSLYWTAQGIYGLFAAAICCFVFGVAASIISPVFPPFAARLLPVGVGVISVLVGVQAAYRNHRWIQRRELAKRNA